MLSLVVTHTRLSGGDSGAASSSSKVERQSAVTGLSVGRKEAASSFTSSPFPLVYEHESELHARKENGGSSRQQCGLKRKWRKRE
jgi:hypothetical protein